jgi:REP element-mobilizing transposase RayT
MASERRECDNRRESTSGEAAPACSRGREPAERGRPSSFPSREAAAAGQSILMGAYTNLAYHVVFATKYRRPLITDDFRERLYEYMGGIIRGLDGHLIQIGGIEDRVHLLANLSPAMAVSDAIREIKANASKWVNELSILQERFEWQKGYGAFTVSYSQIEAVRRYIQNQREHHRRRTFQEEYMEFLIRHGIEFDLQRLFEGEHHG